MKNAFNSVLFRSALVAFIGLTGATNSKADSGGHLLIGITQSGANTTRNDVYYDLGPVSAFTNSIHWNLNSSLSAQGFNLSQIQWGVLGDSLNGDTQFKNPHTALLWYSDNNTPQTVSGYNQWSSMDTPIATIEQTITGVPNTVSTNGQHATILYTGASTGYSWYDYTVNFGQWYNLTGGAEVNVKGTGTPENLWQLTNDGSTPVLMGTITLNSSGVLTFNTIANTPPQPKIVSITRTNDTTWIYFTTTNNFTYKLYYTNSDGLTTSASNWPASTTTVTGSGGAATNHITDTTSDAMRFYRVGVQ